MLPSTLYPRRQVSNLPSLLRILFEVSITHDLHYDIYVVRNKSTSYTAYKQYAHFGRCRHCRRGRSARLRPRRGRLVVVLPLADGPVSRAGEGAGAVERVSLAHVERYDDVDLIERGLLLQAGTDAPLAPPAPRP